MWVLYSRHLVVDSAALAAVETADAEAVGDDDDNDGNDDANLVILQITSILVNQLNSERNSTNSTTAEKFMLKTKSRKRNIKLITTNVKR